MSIFGTPSMFGRPIDPFQHLMNISACHEAAHSRFRHAIATSTVETRQNALTNHHLYLKQLLDEEAGYETDLFKCLKHINSAVDLWIVSFREGDRSQAQIAVKGIPFGFRDTCITTKFRELSKTEQNELLFDICLSFEAEMGTTLIGSYKL